MLKWMSDYNICKGKKIVILPFLESVSTNTSFKDPVQSKNITNILSNSAE